MTLLSRYGKLALAVALVVLFAAVAEARDAAFVDPGGVGGGEEAIKVDPKADIDIGETMLNTAKRTSIFFVNQTNIPVKIEKIVLNSDSNVTAEATNNDCMKQGTIDANSRCSVEVSVTPTSPGNWSVDVLMTHNGGGRLTHARLTGKTSGSGGDHKEMGLAVSSRDVKPVDFGDVAIGSGKTVRSTLMVNDSAEPITIYSIDVIEADNGLQRLDQGCAVDMELAPGASCPVTLVWAPTQSGPVSTDLIIRHSGRLGFAVIPIRGVAKGNEASAGSSTPIADKGVPMPPSATQLEKEMAGKVAPISSGALGMGGGRDDDYIDPGPAGDGHVHLIGTVGDRAVLQMPDGHTTVLSIGNQAEVGSKTLKVLSVTSQSATVTIGGDKKVLSLETAENLVDHAAAKEERDNDKKNGGGKALSVSGGR